MKVISGKYKGRILQGYNLEKTRPTMDRVKESLFAMIQYNLNNAIVLDLFSGSGNLGIESLSMNAQKAYLVDKNKEAISMIKTNLKTLEVEKEQFEVIKSDFQKALLSLKENNIKLDIIFLDPPYKTNYIEESIKLITTYDLLNKNGIIVCESDNLKKIVYSEVYKEIKNRKYGDKYIVILEKKWYNHDNRW